MKFAQALCLLRLMGARHEDALTPQQIVRRWNETYTNPIELRTAQRYLSELSTDRPDGESLLSVDRTQKEWRYHLRLSEIAHWLMDEETAVYQLLSLQVLGRTFGTTTESGAHITRSVAEHLTQKKRRSRRLRETLRIVPDGIGRLYARVDPDILANVIDALVSSQVLHVGYESSKGKFEAADLTPLGLVAKDGAVYLVSVEGFRDPPKARPLHRFKTAHVKPKPATPRRDFDLDDYIRDSHQMSHPIEGQRETTLLVLQVHPKALYHFTERPLAEDQQIFLPSQPGEWAVLKVRIPITVLLVPFLASFGPGIRVLEPESIVKQITAWMTKTVDLYRST